MTPQTPIPNNSCNICKKNGADRKSVDGMYHEMCQIYYPVHEWKSQYYQFKWNFYYEQKEHKKKNIFFLTNILCQKNIFFNNNHLKILLKIIFQNHNPYGSRCLHDHPKNHKFTWKQPSLWFPHRTLTLKTFFKNKN